MRKLQFTPSNRGESSILESFCNATAQKVDVFISDETYKELTETENKKSLAMILSGLSGKHKLHSAVRLLVDDRLHRMFVRKSMFGKKSYLEYLRAFQKSIKKEKIAVLFAHGDCEFGKWVFYDQVDGEPCNIQQWINKHDDNYSCLVLCCCNPGSFTPQSFKSLLIMPDNDLSSIDILLDKCHLSLIDPIRGEIDEYTLESDLRRLKVDLFN